MATPTNLERPVLPEWTRWAWASQVERSWWKSLFGEASNAFQMIEKYSVVERLRPAAWTFLTPEQLIKESVWCEHHNIQLIPTNVTNQTYTYSSKSSNGYSPNKPIQFRCLYKNELLQEHVFPFLDDAKIGRFLGYPQCCQHAFERTWGQGQVDSTWEQLQGWDIKKFGVKASTLWRWKGLRLVPHLPCSYNCEASIALAEQYEQIGIKYGYIEQMNLIKEVLAWPATASRLFGILEITSPAIKISTRTDHTNSKDVFEKDGHYFKPTKELWTDNGFSDPSAMRENHTMLLNVMIQDIPADARIIDLGCGNGMLLRRLAMHIPTIKIAGIDRNAQAIGRAPMLKGKWMVGQIEEGSWTVWKPTIALISIGRLLELTDERRNYLKCLLSHIPTVYVYQYSDLQSQASLDCHCASIELPVRTILQTPNLSVGLLVKS